MAFLPSETAVSRLGPPTVRSPLELSTVIGDGLGDFVPDDTRILWDIEVHDGRPPSDLASFEKAGPREQIFFEPKNVTAAIVTCGGLCPGLNNVVRSIFLELHHNYGVREIYGIRYGYRGMNPAKGDPPLLLTTETVEDIHQHGGTVLGSSRGPEEPAVVVDFLESKGISILFCIGGDGTQRGTHAMAAEVARRGLNIAVVGVPKTIDNDLPFVHQSFGFSTALEIARAVITCAHAESKGAPNGVGLVKLMGREAGFIAAGAAVASQEANFVLIPEVPFPLDGENGLLEALRRRLIARRHAVIVVAEGAGQHLIGVDKTRDASGNVKLHDIGVFLKDRITEYFKTCCVPMSMKYIDPSYTIRSVPANSDDALLCDRMARGAVHAAMAGKTDLLIGLWHMELLHVPLALVGSQKRRLSPESELWRAVLETTGQPRWR